MLWEQVFGKFSSLQEYYGKLQVYTVYLEFVFEIQV